MVTNTIYTGIRDLKAIIISDVKLTNIYLTNIKHKEKY